MTAVARVVIALVLACSAAVGWAALTASLDRDQAAPGESVLLTLQHDGSGGGEPDLAPLRRDFEVLSRSSGTSVQITNGRMSTQRQWQITLVPRHTGQLTVPPLSWDGESSPPLALEVGTGGAPSGGNAGGGASPPGPAAAQSAPVYFTTQLETPTPYVQAAVVLTVRLHAAQPLYQASLDMPGSSDVQVQQLGKDRQSRETVDGREIQVVERRYVLFPQHSGPLRLDGPVLDAQIADRSATDPVFGPFRLPGFVGATRPLRLRADPIALEVRPRPASLGAGRWLPAQEITLTETWKPPAETVRVGEPITRHLQLAAIGAGAAQLPELAGLIVLPDGVKAYPDQATSDSSEQSGRLVGHREQDVALIASQPGTLTLPPVQLAWWDTVHDAPRVAELPARTLTVLPAATVPGTTPAPQASLEAPGAPERAEPVASPSLRDTFPAGGPASRVPWPWISLALALLWLGTLAAWGWRSRRSPSAAGVAAPQRPVAQRSATAAAEREFRRACEINAAPEARRALLAWAAAEWPDAAPAGLQALADHLLASPTLRNRLRELDRACFTAASWEGAPLSRLLPALQAPQEAERAADPLGSLYS